MYSPVLGALQKFCILMLKYDRNFFTYPFVPKVNVGDYDSRCPMHLAAAEARILAVSYLLGISADPSVVDRWGNTPLDEALRGGTLYHMYAKSFLTHMFSEYLICIPNIQCCRLLIL